MQKKILLPECRKLDFSTGSVGMLPENFCKIINCIFDLSDFKQLLKYGPV